MKMISDSDQQILRHVSAGYWVGRSQAILNQPKPYDESEITVNPLPPLDRILITKFENARSRGVLAARQRDLETAKQLFASAWLLLEANLLSEEGKLYYQSYMEQGEAFLDCRHGNFEKARHRTLKSLELDQSLEDCYGYSYLVLHRIQQVHNLARIDAYDHKPQKAIRLALEILAYLDGKIDTLSVPGLWGYDRIARQPPGNVAMMFAQVTGEIALIIAGLDFKSVGNLFRSVAEEFLDQGYEHSCHPYAYRWLLLKRSFSRGDIPDFLTRAADCLAKRYSGNNLLWYSIVVDVITVCQQLNTPTANHLCQEIIQDITNHSEEIHPKFLPFLHFSENCQVA